MLSGLHFAFLLAGFNLSPEIVSFKKVEHTDSNTGNEMLHQEQEGVCSAKTCCVDSYWWTDARHCSFWRFGLFREKDTRNWLASWEGHYWNAAMHWADNWLLSEEITRRVSLNIVLICMYKYEDVFHLGEGLFHIHFRLIFLTVLDVGSSEDERWWGFV